MSSFIFPLSMINYTSELISDKVKYISHLTAPTFNNSVTRKIKSGSFIIPDK